MCPLRVPQAAGGKGWGERLLGLCFLLGLAGSPSA